ncbi:hypothetical protein PRUPE_7G190600 [Prunus persica]|uniref:Uncharacterized protein n=1 Tax=Prunus persica TaxID=3760 RepID=A0A251NDN2_PRUPE|nr:hypothetical protein PRUPE_7G190600 [Prunus persica]
MKWVITYRRLRVQLFKHDDTTHELGQVCRKSSICSVSNFSPAIYSATQLQRLRERMVMTCRLYIQKKGGSSSKRHGLYKQIVVVGLLLSGWVKTT